MKKAKDTPKPSKKAEATTDQVNVRMRKDTIAWASTKIGKRAKSVPAVARQIIEAAQDADENKTGG